RLTDPTNRLDAGQRGDRTLGGRLDPNRAHKPKPTIGRGGKVVHVNGCGGIAEPQLPLADHAATGYGSVREIGTGKPVADGTPAASGRLQVVDLLANLAQHQTKSSWTMVVVVVVSAGGGHLFGSLRFTLQLEADRTNQRTLGQHGDIAQS